MQSFIVLICLFIAVEHIAFMILEMFLWTKPIGRKIFANSAKQAEKTKVLAANQGLYNGFIAAGIIWGLFHPDTFTWKEILLFFTLCASVAGIYGGLTAKRTILYIQGFPAIIASATIAYNIW